MAASVQEATAPVPLQGAEDELVAAASQLRLDDVKVARSFCKVFAARARAAEAHGARAKAFDEWRRCTERAAPAAPASTTPRKRRRTPLKALENIQPTSGGKPRSARSPRSPQPASNGKSGRRSATKSPPRGTPHPYVPPPPPPESPAVASPRRVRWSPVAPAAATAATPEKAAVRRDLFSADEKDAAVPAKEDAPLALPLPAKAAPLALRPRHTPPPKTPADASPVVSPAPRVTPSEAAEQTGAFTGTLGRVARRSGGEAPKTVVTPISSKLEKWRDKYRAGYAPRPAPENFGEKVARPFRFTRPAVGWRCNLCFARNAADAASCELCHEAKPEAAAA